MRVVRSRVEFEGAFGEVPVLVDREEPPAWGPDAELTIVGRPASRVDGVERVTGRARYTADVQQPGMLYARVLRSPYPHARIVRLDTSRAEQLPGVRAMLARQNAPPLRWQADLPLFDEVLRFEGDEVAAVAADDPETAEQALRLIVVDYEPLPFVLDARAALAPDAARVFPEGNLAGEPEVYARGDVERGFAEADVVIERSYRTQAAVHQPLEPHGCVAVWNGDELTVWESTQGIQSARDQLAEAFRLPLAKVRVICEYLGGGFGAKQEAGKHSLIAALLARQTGRPVRLMLTRKEESLAGGCRSATVHEIKLGARRDGTLTAIALRAIGNAGAYGYAGGYGNPARGLYRCSNVRTEEIAVHTNTGPARPFRAPGTTEGTVALECALDEIAAELGIDPLELRQRNYADHDQLLDRPYSAKALDEAYRLAAEAAGWQERGRREQPSGTKRRGIGLASQYWGGGGGPPAYASVTINRDGSAEVLIGGQDIGTGTKTALAQIAAEALGLRLDEVVIRAGDTAAGPYCPTSAGSMTLSSVGPAVRMAAEAAKCKLLVAAAELLGCPPDAVAIGGGEVSARERPQDRRPVAQVTRRLGHLTISGEGYRGPNPPDRALRTFGVQIAEVEVDVETGEVQVLRVVASHDVGRIVNPLGAASQVAGGVIQGLGYALTEDRVLDPQTGRALNANLEVYRVPTALDAPAVECHFVDRPDPVANSIGARGLGEPPIIPTAPAIVNAIADAVGVRIYELPATPARILEALANARREEER